MIRDDIVSLKGAYADPLDAFKINAFGHNDTKKDNKSQPTNG